MGNHSVQLLRSFFRTRRRRQRRTAVNSSDGEGSSTNVSKIWNDYLNQSEIDYEVYTIVSKKYATLKELQTDYSVDDILDLMEIIMLENDLEQAAHKDQEIAEKNNR